MYHIIPDAVSGRWLVNDPAKGTFPCPFLSEKVANDFCELMNRVASLPEDSNEQRTVREMRRTGAPLCEC